MRDPERENAIFRPGSSGFISPGQTDVRSFAAAPVSYGAAVIEGNSVGGKEEKKWDEGGQHGSAHLKQGDGGHGRRKRPRKVSRQGVEE